MDNLLKERRYDPRAGIVCESGMLRLRVVRGARSLALEIDARTPQDEWVVMAMPPDGAGIDLEDEHGNRTTAELQTYDPVLVNGRSIGVALHGRLGDASLTVIAMLDRPQAWSQHFVEITGVPAGLHGRFTQRWHLLPPPGRAALHWPPLPAFGAALSHVSAALAQTESFFAALVPEVSEEDRPLLGLCLTPGEPTAVEYGFQREDGCPAPLSPTARIAYSLCLDARALPGRGFQQAVRWLGSFQAPVPPATTEAILPGPGDLPPLEDAAGGEDWHPFVREGSPAAIAARVHRAFSAVEAGAWQQLEDGLCWLDRLCLQQRVSAMQGNSAPGSVLPHPAWQSIALWLPGLLLRAFRLTGIGEYAARAFAAFNALPAPDRSRVLGYLHPCFGDIYVHVDYREAVTLCGLPIAVSLINDDGIEVRAEGVRAARPLRLVVEGDRESYAVGVNGVPFGRYAGDHLRRGLDITV